MRKIKHSEKDLSRKKKNVDKLLEELLTVHMNKHDRAKTIEIAEKIMSLKPNDAYPMEKVTSIFVDLNETDRADRASKYMEENFPLSGYRVFLKSRVFDLRRDYEGCIKYAEEALTIPGSSLLTIMMIHNILGHAYRYVGDAPKSIEHYYKSSVNDISPYANEPETYKYLFNIKCDDYSNYLFSLHNVNISREDLFKAICAYNDIFNGRETFKFDPKTHPKHDKIRIGYISPDIRRHVVAFFSYAFYKAFDNSKFEVYCYPKNLEDHVSQEFKAGVDGWTNILFMSPYQAAQKIVEDEIDILVDLSGHTANNVLQVMSFKPAPICISAIGWFNSTGLKTIDYFLCDKFTDPVGLNDDFFSEKILRLQHSHFCYMWHDAPTAVEAAPCTKNGYITFVSFNNFAKVTDETLRAWAKIINAVPNSKLYLKGKAFRTEFGINDAKERMTKAGLPLERMIIEADEQDYLKKYNLTDIALDTFPYPGGGTTCDALYMGIPVITLVGERHNGRFGYSLLHNMGLDELCTFSEEEYVQRAIELANDWDRVREYHLTLRRRMRQSPIMNDTIYMAEIETAYEKIWNAWQNGEELPYFPQDEPPVTVEDSKSYYERALTYISYEKDFWTNHIKNTVNIKRAKYWLSRANEIKSDLTPQILIHLAKCEQNLKDYANGYETIKSAESYLNGNDEDKELLKNYSIVRGELALINGSINDSVDYFNKSMAHSSNNEERAKLFSKTLNALQHLSISTEDLVTNNFEYKNFFSNIKPYTTFNNFGEVLRNRRRIRIGYVSPYFKASENFSFIYGVVACHDRDYFEVTAYSLNKYDDPYTEVIEKAVEHFERVSEFSFEKLAQKIHDDQIDILVDLSGHSPETGLPVFAYHPAPIQISGIGASSTSGLNTINYFITDKHTDPPKTHDKLFTEIFIYMQSQFCYASNSDSPQPVPPPSIQNGYLTFGVFTNYNRIGDDILIVWKEILNRVPNSKLLIETEEFFSDSLIDSAYKRLKNLGFNMDMVTFQPMPSDYIKDFLKVDITLDTFPISNGVRTLDSIFMGVPVISYYSERRDSRFALSILENMGLRNFAVTTGNDYVERAVTLANDKPMLEFFHRDLRSRFLSTNAFQPKHYIRVLEQCYEHILRQFQSK